MSYAKPLSFHPVAGAKFGFSNKLPCSPTAIKYIKQNKTEFKRHVGHLKVALRERLVSYIFSFLELILNEIKRI